jgi:ADP-ribose pyrophosphatase YjhB (NUDIX family)
MSHEVRIHEAQTSILRELLFRPKASFAELRKPTGLSSDHFTFHIARLAELGLVEKMAGGTYHLSARGKEYANRLDTDNNTVERQPKTAVILALERMSEGRQQYLFQQRLKQPYYGFWGLPTGKIRWGETILETASRELKEETNLEAERRIVGVYHEHVSQQESRELLEDKIFFVVHCTNARGELMTDFEGGHNRWMTWEEMSEQSKSFGSFDSERQILAGAETFVEQHHYYAKEQF